MDLTFDQVAASRRDAWAKYNEDPSNAENLDRALVASRAYYSWWAEWKRENWVPISMNGQDFHHFNEE